MVNINLDSKTTLTSDPRQWILSTDGRPACFFNSVSEALNYYVERKMRASDAKTINTLLLRQKQIVGALNSVLTPFKINCEGIKNE